MQNVNKKCWTEMRHSTVGLSRVHASATAADLLLLNQCLVKHTHCCWVSCGCVRGQHFRSQGQRSSRPKSKISRPRLRPVIFVMKDSQVWIAQKVWNPQVHYSNNRGYHCVIACVKLEIVCNFMQTCECCKSMVTWLLQCVKEVQSPYSN